MDDLSAQVKTSLRVVAFFSSICLFLWILASTIRPYLAGLLLGMLVGMINAYILSNRIQLLTRRITEGSGKRVTLGFIARVCLSLIAVMICVKSPQFDLVSTIVGLFFTQMVILLMGFLSALKKSL